MRRNGKFLVQTVKMVKIGIHWIHCSIVHPVPLRPTAVTTNTAGATDIKTIHSTAAQERQKMFFVRLAPPLKFSSS